MQVLPGDVFGIGLEGDFYRLPPGMGPERREDFFQEMGRKPAWRPAAQINGTNGLS
jgi:hypothetical protein